MGEDQNRSGQTTIRYLIWSHEHRPERCGYTRNLDQAGGDPMTDDEFLRWLVEANGYVHPIELPGGRYACLSPRMHNTQIIVGQMGDLVGWDDAW